MYEVTSGLQSAGVIATMKHWLLNEQEYRRIPGDLGEAISSNADDRTIHELYAFPFMGAVKAGAASAMCSVCFPRASCPTDRHSVLTIPFFLF